MDWIENIKQRALSHKENNPPEDYWEIDVEEVLRLVEEVDRLHVGYLGESTDNKYQCNCGLILFGHKMRIACTSRDEVYKKLEAENVELKEREDE